MAARSSPINLPHKWSTWKHIQSLLSQLTNRTSDDNDQKSWDMLTQLQNTTSSKKHVDIRSSRFSQLKNYLDNHASVELKTEFHNKLLPKIADVALKLDDNCPSDGLTYMTKGTIGVVRLSRTFVSNLVACGFLCILPENNKLDLPDLNFSHFFPGLAFSNDQRSKLECILNYFRRLSEGSSLDGGITFERLVLPKSHKWTAKTIQACQQPLTKFEVDADAKIEDMNPDYLHIDFANEYIGGGVLFQGAVQEEIRFSICPELLAAMLFMEKMEPDEAIIIKGFERFSSYKGYGWSLEYDGDYIDQSERSSEGDFEMTLCAIDAIPYGYGGSQYKENNIMRDFNKAFVGFAQGYYDNLPQPDDAEQKLYELRSRGQADALVAKKRRVATGNWGCGAFGGDPQFKSLLQWAVASVAGIEEVRYFTFANEHVADLGDIVEKIETSSWTVSNLMQVLLSYQKHKGRISVFEYVLAILDGDDSEGSPSRDKVVKEDL